MKRRKFISLLGGAVAAWPLAARGQQAGKLPTIGFLGTLTPSAHDPFAAAFVQRLHELGWIEGRTVAIEFRWSEHRTERHRELVADLVRLKVDVIVTTGGAVSAAKEATSSIPIVFALAPDPVGSGLVASLARPGGNVTGLSNQQTDVVGKRLELLREVVPDLRQAAILVNVSYPITVPEVGDVRAAADTLGLDVVTLEIRQGSDIQPAIDTLQGRAQALYVVGDPLVSISRTRIAILAASARLPTMMPFREFVEAGGLMSYGSNIPDLFRRAADYVDKILRGAKAADLPVEQPTRFDLVVNLTTAKALGLRIPPSLLARADEVIE